MKLLALSLAVLASGVSAFAAITGAPALMPRETALARRSDNAWLRASSPSLSV